MSRNRHDERRLARRGSGAPVTRLRAELHLYVIETPA